MKIIRCKYFPPSGYKAINIFGILFVRKNVTLTDILINHESIHTKQIWELGGIGFYLAYVGFFIWNLIKYQNWSTSYHAIPFELESNDNEENLEYLDSRKRWAWTAYV